MPGPWANDDYNDYGGDASDGITGPSDMDLDYPRYHEPLNVRIVVRGAISENSPAQVGDVREWTSRWSGPGVGGNLPALNTPHYLSYEYEPRLRFVVYGDGSGAGLLRLPKLPVSSALVLWGERI